VLNHEIPSYPELHSLFYRWKQDMLKYNTAKSAHSLRIKGMYMANTFQICLAHLNVCLNINMFNMFKCK